MHSNVKQWSISGCALSKRSHQQPNTAVVENMLRGVLLSLLLQRRLVLRVPLALQELERRGTAGIHLCLHSTNILNHLCILFILLIVLLKLFGSFFKVMEIMLGNRARITRARVAERATGLLASPSSCPGLPCCSLGYVPWIGIPAGWSDSSTNVSRG